MDTAATVLWLLAVPEPSDWAGQPVVGAYESMAPPPAAGQPVTAELSGTNQTGTLRR